MEETLYFYSTDGSDAHGPVTHDEFCQLIRDHVIGSESFFCHEGETEWRPLEPELFVRPPGTTRLPPYEPPPYVPPPDARERDEERVNQLQRAWEEPGPYAIPLIWAYWILALATTITLHFLRHGENGIGGFLGLLVFITLLPYLVARPFYRIWRLRICIVGLLLLSAVTITGQIKLNAETEAPAATAPKTNATK